MQALAGELPAQRAEPRRRSSTADLTRLIAAHPEAPPMSASTIWRVRATDARKPWQHRSWRYPRDPHFAVKAGRIVDVYAGPWDGPPLAPEDCVVRADEQTSSQARVRCHATTPPLPAQPLRVEHEDARGGALAYLAAWDVRRGGVIGRCDSTTGIVACGKLVDRVLRQEPYRSAPRIFWIVDNGSSHRGQPAVERPQARYPTRILVHRPIQASWRNQIASFSSIVQRKVLTPNDFPDLAAVPFHWRFTRRQLEDRRAALPERPPPRPAIAVPPPLGAAAPRRAS